MKRTVAPACLTLLLLAGCAAAPTREADTAPVATSSSAPVPTSTRDKISSLQQAATRASALPRDKTLVVFDIDDTLLTTPLESNGQHKFFGSDRWYVWQAYGLPETSPDKIGSKCLFEVIAENTRQAEQVETEDEAMEILARIPNDKLLLTSRGPDVRKATEAQLASAGYQPVPSLSASPAPLSIRVGDIEATYANGVFLTKGADKGRALVALLDAVGRHYDHVILVDDTEKNVLNMAIAMALERVNYVGLRYTRIKNDPPLEVTPEQVQAHRRDWASMLAQHPEQAPGWKAGQCD